MLLGLGQELGLGFGQDPGLGYVGIVLRTGLRLGLEQDWDLAWGRTQDWGM